MKKQSQSDREARSLLEHLRWRRRPLLLFEPGSSESPADWSKLVSEVEAREEAIGERDMTVIRLRGDSGSLDGEELPSNVVVALRELFGVDHPEYEAVLLGKDGGVKLRGPKGVELEEIFRLIDSMPMRQAEMRRDS
jgi:hypothetical protein